MTKMTLGFCAPPAHRPSMALLLLFVSLLAATPAHAFSNVEWQKQAVYQIVTDRFAAPHTMPLLRDEPCSDLRNYCGGTWSGMQQKLSYIQGLNLNSLWISPPFQQSLSGYHGYWPTDLYATNPSFGTPDQLQDILQQLSEKGIKIILDVVMNHVGYGSSPFLAPFNPFSDPSYFHNCTLADCDVNCDIPADNPTYEQQWHCQLQGLPDLNHTIPAVRQAFADNLQWILSQFSVHMLRLDAAGHIDPDFFPCFMNFTTLPAWLEVGDLQLHQQYEQVRGNASYSYQSWAIYDSTSACFALATSTGSNGCLEISQSRSTLISYGVEMGAVGYWIENHDTDRFLSTRNSLPAYRNALAFNLLAEGIPIIYYGAEQGMTGFNANNTNRFPLWEVGYDDSNPLYTYIRTLAWYRWWMELGNKTFTEHYVDRRTYTFSRGADMVVVLTNGNYSDATPRPAAYNLSGLTDFAGRTLCDALRSGYCVEVSTEGVAMVQPSPTDEPLVLVGDGWVKEESFFIMLSNRPVLWKQGLIVTFSTLIGALLVWLAVRCAIDYRRTGHIHPSQGLAASWAVLVAIFSRCWRRCSCCGGGGEAIKVDLGGEEGGSMHFVNSLGKGAAEDGDGDMSRASSLAMAFSMVQALSMQSSMVLDSPPSPPSQLRQRVAPAREAEKTLGTRLSMHRVLSLNSLASHRPFPIPLLHTMIECLKATPHMVMHVALEYALPHLGLTSQLMYGGLGKVMETFIKNTNFPMLVCAPMYAPYYTTPAPGTGEAPALVAPFDAMAPLLSLPAIVGGTKHLVDVYVTAAVGEHPEDFLEATDGGGTTREGNANGQAGGSKPPVFFLLLASDIFTKRTRGTIYQHASEAEELAFFSIFNQAVAQVVETLGVGSLQFHDYHGALSIMYLPASIPVRTMLVAHNSDYNGTWHLGTPEREAWVYSQLNIPLNSHTRTLAEHDGRFNMLRPLLAHMRDTQQGLGVVAVSPRYAIRARDKFSMFWSLPRAAVTGILNGMEESKRPPAAAGAADDPDAFFAKKRSAKLAFQEAKGLVVGLENRLLVFMGRITHQKGCDIIAMAASTILKRSPVAQIAMVGPIGDEYGEQAKHMLEKVSQSFPGRVWNGAGLYAMGAEKEQLCMAADYFLCPSRFEPCGLADIEFGWLGAVMIGHNTGGLGKMPGVYYTAELDCTEDQSIRLALTAVKALAMTDEERMRLGTEAIKSDFPPSRMVQAYDKQWRRLHACTATNAAAKGMAAGEGEFYAEQWLEDNTPYNPKESEEWQAAKAQRQLRTWLRNLLLIMMEAVMQVPSVLALLWYTAQHRAGNIRYEENNSWTGILTDTVAIYFYLYAASALLFQAIGFLLPPARYLQLAAAVNLAGVLAFLWSLYIPQIAEVVYCVLSVCASAWVPMAGFIFLDLTRASVSQHGPAIMGFSDALDRSMSVVAVLAMIGSMGTTNITGFEVAGSILLVIAVWLALWLLRPHFLSHHFEYRRLRLRGQIGMLFKQRRTWMVAITTTTLDTASTGYCLSVVWVLDQRNVQWFALAYALTAMVTIAALGILLTLKPGRRLGLNLMWAIAAMPCVTLVQVALVKYGGTVTTIVAATVVGAFNVRTNLVGLLNLHTLPSRETFTIVRTLQVVLGSLALVVGLVVGSNSDSSVELWAVLGTYEALRIMLVAVMKLLHKRENIAKP